MGTQGRNGAGANMQRVKVYRLNDEGKWDDRGTGHVTVEFLEQSEAVGLVVIDEEDNDTLLVHRIAADDIYRRQEETIIAWRDSEIGTELALSFQESLGCSFVWEQICSVQRSIHFPSVDGMENGPHAPNDDLENSGPTQGNDDAYYVGVIELRELPNVEFSNLSTILKIVTEGGIADHVRAADLILQDQTFLTKLLDLFKIYEDLENTEGLHIVFKIVKGIIMLNSSQIFEKIFSDEYIMDIIGALEYDPEIPCPQEHRAFIRDQVVFKEALPIRDPFLLSKIHQTYRVGYIKDVILPRVLDEATFSALNTIIHSNNSAVVNALKDDNAFIQELFSSLKSPDTVDNVKKNMILFLQEFLSLSKNLLLVQQMRLFRELADEGLFEIITSALQSKDKLLRLTGADILVTILNQDPSLLRAFLVQQQGNVLFGLLVKGMSTDFGEDMHCQFVEIIRMVLDPYTMASTQRDSVIELFYDRYMDQLVEVIASSCPAKESAECSTKIDMRNDEKGRQGRVTSEILSNITELLCFCVLQHSYRLKYYFLRNHVIEKVLRLTRRKEKYLIAGAVRFLRTIISRNMQDDFLHRHIVNNNLFDPVIRAFIANGNRYNLLNSAVLDIFELIRKENIKSLVEYFVKTFSAQLEKYDSVGTFKALKLKYEQTLESAGRNGTGIKGENEASRINSNADPRKKMDDRALEKEEEDYFNEDSDDEEDTSVRASRTQCEPHAALGNGCALSSPSMREGSIGLVDYEDEDDDTPLAESTAKEEPEVVKTASTISNIPGNAASDSEVIATQCPKRKFEAESSLDGEAESVKKCRVHSNADSSAVSMNSIDGSEQFLSKEKHALVDQNEGKSVESVEGVEMVEKSANEMKKFTDSRETSNGEINISEARDGVENHGSSTISKDGSALERLDFGVRGNSHFKGIASDGRLSNSSPDLVRAGPPSPEPYTVR